MERSEWLSKMRAQPEALYDHLAPAYWITYGLYDNTAHQQFVQKLLRRLKPHSVVLDAACGAGRYDGMLIKAGHTVLGIDQSSKMLARAREHFPAERFPNLRYAQAGLQEMDFQAEFDGAICVDAMEHVCPEDWPGILSRFRRALRPGAALYVTIEVADPAEVARSYERARAKGLPVAPGEVVDEVDDAKPGPVVYHYYPSQEEARAWFSNSGLTIEEHGTADGYWHVLLKK